MYQSLFQSTTIPVLEQVVQFAQARHHVLAGNIANLDTPGYRVRDLSVEDFRSRLREAIQSRHRRTGFAPGGRPISPGQEAFLSRQTANQGPSLAEVSKNSKTILYHDDSNVGIEHQVTEMVKNQMQHNLALTIMASQFRLLQVAISERV
jgi:flagellar basal-body rod protein FlgB